MPAPEPKGRDNQALAAAFSAFNDKPLRPPAPKNAETRATLEVKYHDSTPAEMQAALDSLLEVLDAQVHQRTEDKMPTSRSQLAALSDEVGWLSERCGR